MWQKTPSTPHTLEPFRGSFSDSLRDAEYLSICWRLFVVPWARAETEAGPSDIVDAEGSPFELWLRRFSLPNIYHAVARCNTRQRMKARQGKGNIEAV